MNVFKSSGTQDYSQLSLFLGLPVDVQRRVAVLLPPCDASAVALISKSAVDFGRRVSLLSKDDVLISIKGWQTCTTLNTSDPTHHPLLDLHSADAHHRSLTLDLESRRGMSHSQSVPSFLDRLDLVKQVLDEVMLLSPFTSLTLACYGVESQQLQLQLLPKFPALHTLIIQCGGSLLMFDQAFRPFQVEDTRNTVKILKLHKCGVDAQSLVKTFPSLERLDMEMCQVKSSASLRHLQHLTDLRLSGTHDITSDGSVGLSPLPTLGTLTSLKILHFKCFDTGLNEIFSICRTLAYLEMLVLEVAAPLSNYCLDRRPVTNLHTLSISFGPHHSGAVKLVAGYEAIKTLSVDPPTHISFLHDGRSPSHLQILGDVRRSPTIDLHPDMLRSVQHLLIPLHCLNKTMSCNNLQALTVSFGYSGEITSDDESDFTQEIEHKAGDEPWRHAVNGGCFDLLRTLCCHPGSEFISNLTPPITPDFIRHPLMLSYCHEISALLSLLAGRDSRINRVIYTQSLEGEFGVIQSLSHMRMLSDVTLINMQLSTADVQSLVQLQAMTRIDLVGCTLSGDGNGRRAWKSTEGRAVFVMQRSMDKVNLV